MGSLVYSSAGLRQTVERFSEEVRSEALTVFRLRARSLAKTLLDITPPAGDGITGTSALNRGAAKMEADVKRIFWVQSASAVAKNARLAPNGITVQLFSTKDGRIYGTDTMHYQPNASVAQMKAHHQKYFVNGKMTSAGQRTRNIGRWKFVDQMVVSQAAMLRYLAERKRDIGGLLGGWVPLFHEVGLPVPSWIEDQQCSGHARIRVTPSGILLTFANETPYAGQVANLQRLTTYALEIEKNKLERQLPYIIAAAARKAGLTTS